MREIRIGMDLDRLTQLSVSWAVMALLVMPLCGAKKDRDTGRVRVLYLGDPIGASPYPFMVDEPLLAPTPVMACKMWYSYETIRRSMRVYMPRTYQGLNNTYDIVILSDSNVLSFETKHFRWFRDLVSQDGGGLAMVGGFESFGGHGYLSWGITDVAEVLPVECLPAYGAEGGIIILQPECPVIANLPWETLGPSNHFGGNKVGLKEGAELIAKFTDSNPLLVWWSFEKGRSYAMASDWTPAGGSAFMTWAYYGDYAVNVVLFTASEAVPTDVEKVHRVRMTLREYSDTKAFLYSLIDFAEKFGANTRGAERLLREAEQQSEESREFYMSYEFDQALASAMAAVGTVQRALDDAIAAKDRAMLWVFLVEWMAVISTCMISGVALYELMIVRRLFKPVDASIFTRDS